MSGCWEDISQPLPCYRHDYDGCEARCDWFHPPRYALLRVHVTIRYQGSAVPSVTVSDTASHVWTEKVTHYRSGVWCGIFETYLSADPGSMNIAVTDSTAHACTVGVTVKVLMNADPDQSTCATALDDGWDVALNSRIAPTAQWSRLYLCGVGDSWQRRSPAYDSYTWTDDSYQDYDNDGCHLRGRWTLQAGEILNEEILGWVLTQYCNWCWCACEVISYDFGKSSSDAGSGSDSGLTSRATLFAADSGSGHEPGSVSGTGANVYVSSTDAATGNDGAGSIPTVWYDRGDTDAATGTEVGTPPPLVYAPPSADYATANEYSSVPYTYTPILAIVQGFAQEGFSLDRVGVLDGTTGAEDAQLYGAQSITITPQITATDLKADDDEIGTWYQMTKAKLRVVNGFLSFATIAQLSGTSVESSNMYLGEYYGLPMTTQYGMNRAPVPLAFRMASRNDYGDLRTLSFVLYAVQLSVLDFTGTAYKTGLQASYSGTVLFSSRDEQGNLLSGPEMGRVVSSPGQQAGAFTTQVFSGL